jgi:fatty acid desaturase
MYVNTKLDHDAVSMSPFLHWIEEDKKSLFGSNGKHIIYAISELAVAVQGYVGHRVRWNILFDDEFPIWLRMGAFLYPFRILTHVIFQGVWFGMCSVLASTMLAGYYFSSLAHLSHANVSKVGKKDCFLEHQLVNTFDIRTFLPHLFLYLDRQTLHHLFPSVDHSRLLQLDDVLKNRMSHSIFDLNRNVNIVLNR